MSENKLGRFLVSRAGWAVLALACGACAGNAEDGTWVGDEVTHNDFEAVAGWGGADRRALTRDHAHSGRYAVVADTTRKEGLLFDLPLFEASVHTLQAADVEAWVYLPSDKADAALQVEAVADGPEPRAVLYSEAFPLLPEVKEFKHWTLVQHIFHLPGGLPGSTHLRLFLKHGSGTEPVYLDDIRVKAREW
jgi:hypothetical protein